jgi:hypothetical protein
MSEVAISGLCTFIIGLICCIIICLTGYEQVVDAETHYVTEKLNPTAHFFAVFAGILMAIGFVISIIIGGMQYFSSQTGGMVNFR